MSIVGHMKSQHRETRGFNLSATFLPAFFALRFERRMMDVRMEKGVSDLRLHFAYVGIRAHYHVRGKRVFRRRKRPNVHVVRIFGSVCGNDCQSHFFHVHAVRNPVEIHPHAFKKDA